MLSNVYKLLRSWTIIVMLFSLIGIASLTYMHSSSTNNTIDKTDNFRDDLTLLKEGTKFGWVDKSGKFVIPLQFDATYGFHDGRALVQRGGKWGYIDKSGKYVISPQFEATTGFIAGLARVQKAGQWFYIDKTGRTVAKP